MFAYLAALAGNAAVVVTRGLVGTHHTWLILFEVAGYVPWGEDKDRWIPFFFLPSSFMFYESHQQPSMINAQQTDFLQPHRCLIWLFPLPKRKLWVRQPMFQWGPVSSEQNLDILIKMSHHSKNWQLVVKHQRSSSSPVKRANKTKSETECKMFNLKEDVRISFTWETLIIFFWNGAFYSNLNYDS